MQLTTSTPSYTQSHEPNSHDNDNDDDVINDDEMTNLHDYYKRKNSAIALKS